MFLAIILFAGRLFFIKSRSNVLSSSILVLFIAAVTTHLLTSFLIMGALIALYLIRKLFLKKVKLPSFFSITVCILLISIFFFYQTMVINNSFVEISQSLYSQILGQETHLTEVVGVSQNRVIGSTAYALEIFSTYSLVILAVTIAFISILIIFYGLLRHKTDAKLDVFWVAWIIIAGILGLSISYGGEGITRAFMFMLVPTCYFAIKYLSKKPRLLVAIIILVVFIHFPAAYAHDNYLYVPTSELKGQSALEAYAPTTTLIFYEDVAPGTFHVNETWKTINIQFLSGLYTLP